MAKKFHMGRVELAEELTDKLAGAARALEVGARLRRAQANRLPKDLDELDQWATEALRPLWEHPAEVRSQIGRGWLPPSSQRANSTSKCNTS